MGISFQQLLFTFIGLVLAVALLPTILSQTNVLADALETCSAPTANKVGPVAGQNNDKAWCSADVADTVFSTGDAQPSAPFPGSRTLVTIIPFVIIAGILYKIIKTYFPSATPSIGRRGGVI